MKYKQFDVVELKNSNKAIILQIDFRIKITSNQEKRFVKIAERTLEKRGTNNEEEFAKLRENVFARFIDNIDDVDVVIHNDYSNEFEKELINLCSKINA